MRGVCQQTCKNNRLVSTLILPTPSSGVPGLTPAVPVHCIRLSSKYNIGYALCKEVIAVRTLGGAEI